MFDLFNRDGGACYQGVLAELRIYDGASAFGSSYEHLYNELRQKWIGDGKVKPDPAPEVPLFARDGNVFAYVDDEKFGPSEDYQWWIDTRNFEEDMPPTTTNIWNDWAI